MKNMQNKWFLSLNIIIFASSAMSYGMETEQQKEEKEFQTCFEKWLPQELQQETRRLQLMRNAVEFLGLRQPITLAGNIIAIAGNKVATSSEGNYTVKIWDINTGQELHLLVGHTNKVKSVAISADKVVTGSSDYTAKIWGMRTGQLMFTRRYKSSVSSVAIAGHKLVVGLFDNTGEIWDFTTDQRHRLGYDMICSIAVTDDKVVTGSSDYTAEIRDINTGQLLLTLEGHTSDVQSIAIAGDKVVTGSLDETAKIWDINTGQLLRTLEHIYWVRSVAIVGDKVVTVSGDGTAKIWDINTGQLLRTLVGQSAFTSVTMAGDKVVTRSEDGTAEIWSLSLNLKGTSEDNPLVWIVESATIPQLDFVNRAHKATSDKQYFAIALPEKLGKVEENESQAQRDGRIYFTFPKIVRNYLRDRLHIKPVVVPKHLLNHLNIKPVNTKPVKLNEPAQLSESTERCLIQ